MRPRSSSRPCRRSMRTRVACRAALQRQRSSPGPGNDSITGVEATIPEGSAVYEVIELSHRFRLRRPAHRRPHPLRSDRPTAHSSLHGRYVEHLAQRAGPLPRRRHPYRRDPRPPRDGRHPHRHRRPELLPAHRREPSRRTRRRRLIAAALAGTAPSGVDQYPAAADARADATPTDTDGRREGRERPATGIRDKRRLADRSRIPGNDERPTTSPEGGTTTRKRR